jgi:hypothetical protein
LRSVSQNVLKFDQQLTGEERRIPFIFDDFHFCRFRVIGLDMTENRIWIWIWIQISTKWIKFQTNFHKLSTIWHLALCLSYFVFVSIQVIKGAGIHMSVFLGFFVEINFFLGKGNIFMRHTLFPENSWFLQNFRRERTVFILVLKKMENVRRYFSIFEAWGGNFCFHLKFTFCKKWSKRIQRTKIQIGVAGVIFYYTPAPRRGRGVYCFTSVVCPSFRPSKIFFVTFFSVTVDGRNLIFGHKHHIGIPYCG